MRALRSLLAAALLLAAAPLPALAGATALTTLNVRAGPGAGYAVVDVLHPGEAVEVEGCRPGWCFIQTRHAAGWASAGYLAGLVDHVVVHRRVARWPDPWSEPIYPPRRNVPRPWPHAVPYPERFW